WTQLCDESIRGITRKNAGRANRLEGSHSSRKIWRLRESGYVCAPSAVDGDGKGFFSIHPAQVRGINQRASRRINLCDENVVEAAPVSWLFGVCRRKIDSAG